jgi:PAS domain S-box-containing protein
MALISRISRFNRKWAIAALVSAALLASAAVGVGVIQHRRSARLLQGPFRIGFYNSLKQHFPDSSGQPSGSLVDLLNEAARRRGIQLQWVYSPQGPDAALETGQVDLWPTVGDLPERKGHLYISAPWRVIAYGLVSRANDPITSGSDSAEVSVAAFSGHVEEKLAKRQFPNAKFVYVASTVEQLSAVCDGSVQAAVITQNFNEFSLPQECRDVPLQMVDAPGFTINFGIGASYHRPGAVQAADVLRDELGVLADDGTLVNSEFRWLDGTLPDTRAMLNVRAVERSERWLGAGAIVLAAILVLLAWLISERKRREEALRESDRRFKSLFEDALLGLYRTTPDGKILMANPALCRMLGYESLEDLQNCNVERDLHVSASVRGDFKKQMEDSGGIVGMESVWKRRDGKAMFVLESARVTRDSAGRILYYEGSVENVTQRKRAEDALSEERWLLRALIDNLPDYIYVKDAASRFLVANRGVAELMGAKTPEEVLGKTDFDYFPVELATSFFSDEQAIVRSGQALLDQEERTVDAEGNAKWMSTSKVPWRDKHGKVIGVMGIGRDISERKSAEENFYKAFNASPEPITIATLAEGRYLDVNESFLRVSGYRREEVIGRTSLDLEIWENAEVRARILERLTAEGSVRDVEVPFRTKSGEQRVWLHSMNRIEFAGQECVISSQKDITETKALALQLNQAQKMESVGRLAGGVAHDFNNLLSVIIGYSDVILANPGLDSHLQKQAEEIRKAGNRAAGLTRQLLAFSRQQVMEPKVLNLNSIVMETEKMLRRLIGEDIEFETRLATDMASVKADPGQIEQILMNLAVNARDAMPRGGRLIIETAEAELDEDYARHHPPCVPGWYVVLTVTDTGIGMDQETKAHIFEPFFTTKDVGKGTGLGLATVYGIVKQSGGYVWVYSELGHGSVFKVYLPRVDKSERRIPAGEIASETINRSETVLVVEDEESVRALICSILGQNGYTVLEAANPADALKIAQQVRTIHLLLTDVVMPGMSGPAMAKKIEEMRPGLKVLFMSGYAGGFGAAHGLLEDGMPLLQKPFSKNALLQRLSEAMEMQKELKSI